MSSADTRTAAIDVAIMTTARDAVMDAYRPCTISSPHADAVLSALGIPPDTPADRIVVLDDDAIERAARAMYHADRERRGIDPDYTKMARAALVAAEERDA